MYDYEVKIKIALIEFIFIIMLYFIESLLDLFFFLQNCSEMRSFVW